jgi:hypothetical protein
MPTKKENIARSAVFKTSLKEGYRTGCKHIGAGRAIADSGAREEEAIMMTCGTVMYSGSKRSEN